MNLSPEIENSSSERSFAATDRPPATAADTCAAQRVATWSWVVATIAVACLGGGVPTAHAQPPLRSWLAAGDSYSSGEGLPHAEGPCARAVRGSGSLTWADVARDRIALALPALGSPRLVACTGARSGDFFSSNQWTPGIASIS